ncbi:MAG: hypothetical protein HF973_14830 [Chloroflexi bacterium]|nr:hypothetical protein [Chloroflexota bacterium]
MLLKNAATPSTPTQTRPVVRWLALGGWMLVALANLLFFLFDLISDYSQMLVPCAGVLGMAGGCNFLAISSEEVAVLSSWGLTLQNYAAVMLIPPVICLLAYWALGGLILWRQGTSRLGLTVSLALIVLPVSTISGSHDWSGNNPTLIFLAVTVAILGNVIMIGFLYLLPNGRFSPQWAYIPLTGTIMLVAALSLDVNGIIALSAQTSSLLQIIIVGLVLFGGSLQIYRYLRDANTEERQQTKWIIFGVVSYVVTVMLWVLIFGSALVIPAGRPRLLVNLCSWFFAGSFLLLILPAAITIAILRYKLWNIDPIINRTLVYGGLTLMVVLLYILTVGGLGLLFRSSGSLPISLIATGLIAVAFHPVRERLQRGVNRLMYGQRDDPVGMLTHLAQRLETADSPESILPTLVETIATTLKLPYAALWLPQTESQWEPAAVFGQQTDDLLMIPLLHQNREVGRLFVAPRGPGERFSQEDERLLATIAQLSATSVQAAQLTFELQQSRRQLVTSREEERRRLRRDLHDGLGPVLAAVALQADTARDLTDSDPAETKAILNDIMDQAQTAVSDVRRLVYNLRPPALDELGLAGALRQLAQTVQHQVAITIDTQGRLPPLPAAVEVAAYRIAQEAMHNVVKHARASRCTVTIGADNGLLLVIVDNGWG